MDRFDDEMYGELWFSATDWAKLLYLATLYGYDPTFAEPEDPVSAEELGTIAAAVEEALDDIPNHNASGGKTASRMSPFEWFSGPRKEKLLDFVAFCKETQILGE